VGSTPTQSIFINLGKYGIELSSFLAIVGQIQQQWLFNNFHIMMATEDATEKVKFSSRFFLQYMVQHYIMLIRLTDQGIRNIKDTTRRADAAKSEAERIGGKLTVYWTFGKYDAIGILEAPNDEAAMQFELKVGSLGNVRTTTLKAFTEEEIAKLVDKLG
jgi:uncharacterized protein with GYD domain